MPLKTSHHRCTMSGKLAGFRSTSSHVGGDSHLSQSTWRHHCSSKPSTPRLSKNKLLKQFPPPMPPTCLGDGLIFSCNRLWPCIKQLRLYACLTQAANNGLTHLHVSRADEDGPTVALVVQHDLLKGTKVIVKTNVHKQHFETTVSEICGWKVYMIMIDVQKIQQTATAQTPQQNHSSTMAFNLASSVLYTTSG